MHHKIKSIGRSKTNNGAWLSNRKRLDCIVFRGQIPKDFEYLEVPHFVFDSYADILQMQRMFVFPYASEFDGSELLLWCMTPHVDPVAHYLIPTARIGVAIGAKNAFFEIQFNSSFTLSGWKILKRGFNEHPHNKVPDVESCTV